MQSGHDDDIAPDNLQLVLLLLLTGLQLGVEHRDRLQIGHIVKDFIVVLDEGRHGVVRSKLGSLGGENPKSERR